MDTFKLITQNAKQYPDKTALIFKEQAVTFGQMKDIVLNLAAGFKKIGIKKQDKIAIYLPNCPQYIYSYLALFSMGATVIPLDFMLKEEEITSYLNHSEAKLLIAKYKANIELSTLRTNVKSLKNIILIDEDRHDFLNFNSLLDGKSRYEKEDAMADNDTALILYTSGTSGNQKGVVLTYKHLSGSPEAMKYFVDLNNKDIKICCLPLSHSAGLIYIQNCIVFAITLILMERFSPLEFLNDIERYKVSCFHIVPSMYYAILQLKEFEKHDLSSLRWMVVFGAPNAPDVLKRFNQYCPKTDLLNGWGLTETCPPNTVIPLGSKNIQSVGKPAPWIKIAILDDSDEPVAPGEIGEIAMRSWVVMKEYYNNPEETRRVLKNGWFYTGDLGRFDEDGFLYIAGRKKEMIKVSGQLVYAPEVEAVLHKQAGVLEAAVIGVPDKLRGESIKAFIAKDPASNLSESQLRIFCQEHLAHFKVPHKIEFVAELPKNRTGKIDKEALKRRVTKP
ncbi:MAG: hypothetical protein COV72_04160 [Candidatus Omnitrophica bacterium CG11_big_fil_rev_8_21_14_0_20_42_13]|uniref:Long-chain fatty acid--CoA ligase n=1 Tax=Candidatus Ghiorseimicrobium undicola TaxID=1974746 RepID=A0A2H0LXT8_9BACT|nr:MAG: hypothetical protein COV72_04160 [Candidatus Omnitrophica bacterium CG11_big_fil_rev_8_21_14_0_20_42_13]